jgi:putative transposase
VSRYDPQIHHRRSIRLKGYDYAQEGAYFITICAYNRECLFGEIDHDDAIPSAFGEVVRDEWVKSSEIRAEIQLGEFVIMPNHFHAIAQIVDGRGDRPVARTGDWPVARTGDWPVARTGHAPTPPVGPTPGPKSKSIGALVAGFKSAVTKRINAIRNSPGAPVWQRGYWEHIIRDEADYRRIAEYITQNPRRWADDSLHPDAGSCGGQAVTRVA